MSILHARWIIPGASGVLLAVALLTEHLLGAATLGDATMVAAAIVAGGPIVLAAVRGLRARVVGIDLLVSVAAIGAVVIGEFWEAAAVTFLFAIGHALEAATLARTRSALAELIAVAPRVAVVLRDGDQVEVPAGEVGVGETVLVKDGAKVPVDGTVSGGTGAMDESSITGESMPVEKVAGDSVFAGTVSTGGFLQVEATGVGVDTTLARIIHRVEEAQDAKARTQRFMDRFSAWYTPAIIALALMVGLATRDVVLGLTLLVIGCPGALVISIPVSIVAGIGRAARDGILIRGGEYLETSGNIDAVALDKTGTLTTGRPRLVDLVILDPSVDRAEVLSWAARAEAGSDHPFASPILAAAKAEGIVVTGLPEETTPVPGRGIVAVVAGRRVLVGNVGLLDDHEVADSVGASEVVARLAAGGQTPMLVAVDDRVIGVLAVADELRGDASRTVAELHRAGVDRVVMLTGDVPAVAESIGRTVGIDDIRAGLLPEDKLAAIAALQRDGYTVAMVGDGVNDAPALAIADIGIAMGAAGSAVAVETADIALMGDRLSKLSEAVRLAHRTVNNLRQNIVIALITVVALVAGVLFGGLTMAIGMLVHE
ncbi:MAG: cation-translocating P-type ATPase, partial [Nitriliruptoraceae bacterium]